MKEKWKQRLSRHWIPATVFIILVVLSSIGLAQSEAVQDVNDPPSPVSLWGTIAKGGIIGYVIIAISMVALSLIVQNFMSIRRDRVLPEALIENLDELISGKQINEAHEACIEDGSFLSHIVASGLSQVGSMFGYFDMQNTMQETSERELSKLYRKLEYLAFIGSTSPMLGLLGTVTGMIASFNQIAQTEGAARPSQLAGGISEALITTCLGLIVAIPSMFFTAFFRRRIDSLVAEVEITVEKLMRPFRKAKLD